jgi:hypothetical protein
LLSIVLVLGGNAVRVLGLKIKKVRGPRRSAMKPPSN